MAMRALVTVLAASSALCCGPKGSELPETTVAIGPQQGDGDLQPGAGAWDEAASSKFKVVDQKWSNEQFGFEIARTYQSDDEAALIAKAEGALADEEAIIATIGTEKLVAIGYQISEPLWWYQTFDGIRIPWAVTSDAVQYYLDVIMAFRDGNFSDTLGITMKKAYFGYEVSVNYLPKLQVGGLTVENVHMVTMKLSWSQFCGPECAMGFFKTRDVVFDSSGTLLFISGDGATDYIVS
jgi:hypothetical protein